MNVLPTQLHCHSSYLNKASVGRLPGHYFESQHLQNECHCLLRCTHTHSVSMCSWRHSGLIARTNCQLTGSHAWIGNCNKHCPLHKRCNVQATNQSLPRCSQKAVLLLASNRRRMTNAEYTAVHAVKKDNNTYQTPAASKYLCAKAAPCDMNCLGNTESHPYAARISTAQSASILTLRKRP